jgi:26S proteasome regulatory subunit N5
MTSQPQQATEPIPVKEDDEEEDSNMEQKEEKLDEVSKKLKLAPDATQDSKMDEDSDEDAEVNDPKPTAEIEEKVNQIIATSQSLEFRNLPQAIEQLLYLEKKQRQAEVEANTVYIAKQLLQLCYDSGDWDITVEQIAVLSRRRSQFHRVIIRIVQQSMQWVAEVADNAKKLKLIDTLINVTEGKIFFEVQRARLTRIFSKLKEDEGNVAEACDILQELQIETFGSMRKKEKCEFLLEQVRLNLCKKDFIRAGIVRNKIKERVIKSIPKLEIDYWNYSLIYFYHSDRNFLDLCKSYRRLKDLLENKLDQVSSLANAIFAIVLAKYSNESKDLWHRILKHDEKLLEELPVFQQLLTMLTTNELISFPLPDAMMNQLTTFEFTGVVDDNQDFESLFHDRIVQHNIRVIAKYYSRISSKRLSQFLSVSEQDTERYVSDMVTSAEIYARIDRLDGIIQFRKKETANSLLNNWRADTNKLLELVDLTCHQIHKEMMIHSKDKKKGRK